MRILYISNDLAYFRAHRENIALAMAKDGHDIFVASGDCEGVDVTDWPTNITLLPLELNKHRLDPRTDIDLVWKLRTIMVEHRPDIVHAITIKPILMSALAARLFLPNQIRSRMKFVWTFAGLGKVFEATDNLGLRARKFLVIRALRFCRRKIIVDATFENPSDRNMIVLHKIVPENNTQVLWGAGLALEEFTSIRSNEDDHPIVFLMATRLIRGKGVDTYLKTAEKFSAHPAKPQFLLAGIQDPSNPDNVDLAEIKSAHNAGHIEFLGAVSGKDMPTLYNRSDVFCLPTRLREGFPRSLLEAAACGCALIASDQTSIRQILLENETGFLLPTAGVEEFSQAVETALTNPQSTRKLGINANKFAHALPISQEHIVDAFKEIYSYSGSD